MVSLSPKLTYRFECGFFCSSCPNVLRGVEGLAKCFKQIGEINFVSGWQHQVAPAVLCLWAMQIHVVEGLVSLSASLAMLNLNRSDQDMGALGSWGCILVKGSQER